jgi:hypothetical protein
MKKLMLACACLSVLALPARADDEEKEAPPTKTTATPLKLSVVYTRSLGEKKISSLPYTLSLNAAGGPSSRLRMGLQVPLKINSPDVPGNIVFKDVSNNIDCRANPLADARFLVTCTIEQSSVYQGTGETGNLSISSTPVLRIFRADEAVVLRDGQTTTFTTATDPLSGEVLKVDVTLNVVK